MNNRVHKVRKFITTSAIMTQLLSLTVSANAIENSDIGQGLLAFFTDLSAYIAVVGPIVSTACAGYYLVRKSMADEADGKMWQKRIVVAILCAVGTLLVGGIIYLILSYFKK